MRSFFRTPVVAQVPNDLSPPRSRLLGLDWLRAVAAVLVVMLHAAIPYQAHPFPGLKWSVLPLEQSHAVDVIGWCIDGFIMPVFFVMNGYFAAKLLKQHGEWGFFRHRLKRIGGPLLFGLLVILPMDLYVWLLGWVAEGLIPINKMRSLKIRGELGNSLHGVSHLWFLQYVLVYCFLACVVSKAGQLRKFGMQKEHALKLPSANHPIKYCFVLLTGILISGVVLCWQPRIVIGFRHAWGPLWENLIYYAVPFCLGWFWSKWAAPMRQKMTGWSLQIALAAGIFLLLWPDLCRHLEQESIPAQRAHVPLLFAAFGLLASTGMFGLALSLPVIRIPAAVGYLSRASFWVYLFHHPIVGLVQVDLRLLQAPALVKFFLSTVITLAVCLLTYEGLVRKTWIGELLNGTRDLPSRAKEADVQPERTESRQAA